MNSSYRLVLKSGPNAGNSLDLSADEITIGRDVNATFVINDPEVSRRHARVYQQGANIIIEDLGSTNGTSVSGQRLSGPYILRPGEIITLGEHTTVLFEMVQLDPDATVASLRPMQPVAQSEAAPVPTPVYQQAEQFKPAPALDQVPLDAAPAVQTSDEYVGRVPAKPKSAKPAGKKKMSALVVVLIVVVIVLACGCIAFAIFDALNLYCDFPGIMNFLIPGACPP